MKYWVQVTLDVVAENLEELDKVIVEGLKDQPFSWSLDNIEADVESEAP